MGPAEETGEVGEPSTLGMIGAVISIFLQLSPSGPAGTMQPDSLRASRITEIKAPIKGGESMGRDIIGRLPATSAADAIRYFTGVQVKDYGGIGGLKTVNVRSLGSHHTGVFYNGIKINNAQNGQVDIGRFPVDYLESISVYNGQKTALLQTATEMASSAAVYLKGLSPASSGIKASFRSGAFGTINPSVYAGYSGRAKAFVSAAWLGSNGKYRFTFHKPGYDTTATRANGDIKALRAEIGLEYQGLTLNACIYASGRGLPGPVIRRVSDQYNSKDRQWDRNAFLQASWKRQLSQRMSIMLGGKLTYDFCRYLQDPSKNAAVLFVDNRYRQREGYMSAALSYNILEWLGAGLAADGRYNWLSNSCESIAAAAVPRAERFEFLRAIQLLASPGKGWHISASMLWTNFKDKTSYNDAWENHVKPTPYFSVSYEGIKSLGLRLAYKESFRAPTFNDLYYTIGGQTKLNPEYTRQLEAGASWTAASRRQGLLRLLRLTAEYYTAKVSDKITAVPGANQFRWSVINYGLARIEGADASIVAELHPKDVNIRLRTTYTYENAIDRTSPSSPWYGGRLAYSPMHSGSATAVIGYKGIDASASWLYTGVRFRDSSNTPDDKLQPWYTTDLSLSCTFIAGACRARLSADINNVFDQDYEIITRYPMPGRHILLKLAIEY